MAIFASLIAKLGFETSQWTKGTQTAGRDLKGLDAQAKGFFKDLKSSFGKSSTLGQSIKLIAGGGAVGALNAAGKELKEFAEGITKLKDDFNDGKLSGREYAQKIAESIPVLGKFFQAGEAISEMFSGQKAALRKLGEEYGRIFKMQQKGIDQSNKMQAETKELTASLEEQRHKLANSTALAGIKDDTERQIAQLKQEGEDQLRDLEAKAKAVNHQDKLAANNKTIDLINDKGRKSGLSKEELAHVTALLDENKRIKIEAEKDAQEIADTKVAIEENTAAKISEIQDKAADEDAKKQTEADDKAAKQAMEDAKRVAIADLEGQKKTVEDAIKAGEHADHISPANVQAMRGGGIVQLGPNVNSPQLEIAKKNLAKLDEINKGIAALKDRDAGSETYEVSANW